MSKNRKQSMGRVAIDTGGTFTDFVRVRDGQIEISKELSTPQAPEHAILTGLERLSAKDVGEIIHGSTVATNALLERKGARTALITTAGFEDVLVIGRQTRHDLYNIFTTHPDPLVPDALRIGVRQRTLYDGTRQVVLKKTDLQKLVKRLQKAGVESVAVSLLFSFVDPTDEQAVGDALGKLRVPISLSSSILPEYREYERTSTTVINAYLAPIMGRYLSGLAHKLDDVSIRVMQSNGGAVRASTAMDTPVQTILSGPAGGVVGAFSIGKKCGYSRLISFDMGGTSTDVALLNDQISVTHENHVDDLPIAVPMMDMHTVGAGGGSIAYEDAGGALKVGPKSAGADPGPICYGTGTEFTVTDANVVLGRLIPRFFLGGGMDLDVNRIAPVVRKLKGFGNWPNLESMAEGVIEVVNNNMEQAIRLISLEQGYDVREYTLVTFGGAGALHAATLAAGLGIPRVIVPPHPGALSALGLLLADARKDHARTLIGQRTTTLDIQKTLDELHREGLAELRQEGFQRRDIVIMDFVDVRYQGQSYELTIPFNDDWVSSFHRAHDQRYGHSNPASTVEIVSARSTLLGKNAKPTFKKARRKTLKAVPVAREHVWANGQWMKAAIYDRLTLQYGNVIKGPAIIGEYSSTTYVPREFRCEVDAWKNLVLTEK